MELSAILGTCQEAFDVSTILIATPGADLWASMGSCS